jgi:leader peptidase (prepilin peptidase)/N-methyltransferase
MEIVIAVIAGLLGIVIGGVINVLADDLPARRDPRLPRYPDGTPRPPSAWLGLTAFLTGQRSAPPGVEPSPAAALDPPGESTSDDPSNLAALEAAGGVALDGDDTPPEAVPRRLGWRWPLVEIVSGLSFAGLVLGFPGESNLPVWMVWVVVMLLITVIDMEHHLILFSVIIPACLFALVVAAVTPEQGKPFTDFLIGGAVGFGLFYLMFLGGAVFGAAVGTDEIAFGFGDVMLAMLSGLILGWQAFVFAALVTVFAGAAGALLYVLGRALLRRGNQMFMALPYGPYIVLGTLVMLLFRDEVKALLQGG